MLPLEKLKQRFFRTSQGRKLARHQKACPRCERIVHIDLLKCPSCECAPWTWQPNARFLVIAALIAAFIFILMPLLTPTEKPPLKHLESAVSH